LNDHAEGSDLPGHEWAAELVDAQESMDGRGIGDRLHQVCLATIAGPGMSGSVVTLKTVAGSEAVAASSDTASRGAAELEFGLGEGPSRDAFRHGRPVLLPDLVNASQDWLRFGAAAVEAGWGAVFAFPLRVGAVRFGVLTMLDRQPHPLDRLAVGKCLALATLTTDMLLQSSDSTEDGDIDPQLKSSLEFRSEVYQAQGMVMAALETDLTIAIARMRAHAFAIDRSLLEVSREILAGRLHLTPDDRPRS
jgi:hypothetical protein